MLRVAHATLGLTLLSCLTKGEMWEVLDLESRWDLFQTLVFFPFKRDSSVNTEISPSFATMRAAVVRVTLSCSYDRHGVCQAEGNPPSINKGRLEPTASVLSTAQKALARCFTNIRGPHASSETHGLSCYVDHCEPEPASAQWWAIIVRTEHRVSWETLDRTVRAAEPSLLLLHRLRAVYHFGSVSSAPSSSSDYLVYVGRRNIQPHCGTTFAENNPIAFYFCAMFYCYFRFFLVYKAKINFCFFFPGKTMSGCVRMTSWNYVEEQGCG